MRSSAGMSGHASSILSLNVGYSLSTELCNSSVMYCLGFMPQAASSLNSFLMSDVSSAICAFLFLSFITLCSRFLCFCHNLRYLPAMR